jgi:putative glutamine amidotransferase
MRIAIPVATTIDIPYNQRSAPAYASAVTRSGGEPVAIDITLSPAEILALAATCDGILLPGSPADVDPSLYGQPRDPATARADVPRETADYLLLDHAAATGKPVLCICYGLQSLNVWRGGSLIQDLTPLPVNHEAGSKVAIAHAALIAPDSLLASLLTPDEAPLSGDFLRLPINTSHHQAVAAPGDGLRIVARCPDDGVIEALELAPGATLDYHPNSPCWNPRPSPKPSRLPPPNCSTWNNPHPAPNSSLASNGTPSAATTSAPPAAPYSTASSSNPKLLWKAARSDSQLFLTKSCNAPPQQKHGFAQTGGSYRQAARLPELSKEGGPFYTIVGRSPT